MRTETDAVDKIDYTRDINLSASRHKLNTN